LAQREFNMKEYEKLFKECYVPVLRYCCTMVLDADDAEDIVQQVFVSLWQKIKNNDIIRISARAYLYKAVYNASLDFLKHKKVRKKYEDESLINDNGLANANDITDSELQKKIQDSIAQLPDQCRRIFKMNRFENLKYREIAAELNIAEKTVENQMGKALKMLKRSLKDYLPLLLTIIYLYNER
jgi:RNA polymerase sigma-70 factor (ECF subfamily)